MISINSEDGSVSLQLILQLVVIVGTIGCFLAAIKTTKNPGFYQGGIVWKGTILMEEIEELIALPSALRVVPKQSSAYDIPLAIYQLAYVKTTAPYREQFVPR